jgi:hypothetical protein
MKEELNNVKERLTNLNNTIGFIIEELDYAKNERQVNNYFDRLWEVTKEIRNLIGSPNSRKN